MRDRGRILAGLVIALVLLGLPFFYNVGRVVAAPEPSLDTPEIAALEKKECVESTPFMRENHMQLLRFWRDSVVRRGARIYVNSRGEEYPMSLQKTCQRCHSNRSEFCDRCHNYAAVEAYCWDCHTTPEDLQ